MMLAIDALEICSKKFETRGCFCQRNLKPGDVGKKLSCGHIFHIYCPTNSFTKSHKNCPLCNEEFSSGFGSHTPILLGQAKVVCYFPHYERTLNVTKTIMKEKSFVYNKTDEIINLSKDGKLEDITHAKSCSDLLRAVVKISG